MIALAAQHEAVADPAPVSACTKVSYRTRQAARRAWQQLIRSGKSRDPGIDWQLNEYRCERCGRWHFGHSSSATLVRRRVGRPMAAYRPATAGVAT